ncbi:MAG: transpeptidase family protein [Prevotellaceae bacterium]|jgi:cell division protein FtsI (penicillin-binding protein 3)|nr:transpeptidase family protein [Prevotellaceae bacterium]
MPDKRENIVLRFGIVYVLIALLFVAVIAKIVHIQTVERDTLLKLAAKNRNDTIVVKPLRGNIYAADGRLMASSIPSYTIYMDTRVPGLRDTIERVENRKKIFFTKNGHIATRFEAKIDSVSAALAQMFGDRTAQGYKTLITNAYRRGDGALLLYPRRISYSQLKAIRKMPLFRYGRNKSGLIPKEYVERIHPFGSLASRTVGNVYGEESKGGEYGIELSFNQTLTGKNGMAIVRKIANTTLENIVVEPVAGNDIVTTIDVDMQDIAETALRENLQLYGAREGCVILMETQSGEVKSIVNLQRNADGSYSENHNIALLRAEPGSTFKTVSIMAALDDGLVSMDDTIDTGNGLYNYGRSTMRDHNWRRGGFHKITIEQAIAASSNVAVSRAVYNAYNHNLTAFVDKLQQMGIEDSMKIEIAGAQTARLPRNTNDITALPWSSIGYQALIPPIYTLAFYNAIANDGKMIRPFFVKNISSNGRIIKTFGTETIRGRICSAQTLEQIRNALLGVVYDNRYGTAQIVRSDIVRIAGKTGTALIDEGSGYGGRYQVSFCGYFPAEKPQYTCIAIIREPQGSPSGGIMAGIVVKKIAENLVNMQAKTTPLELARDSAFDSRSIRKTASVKNGNYAQLKRAARQLNFSLTDSNSEWVTVRTDSNKIETQAVQIVSNLVPNVVGMGAKDAVYLMEHAGLRVTLLGRGKVASQTMQPGLRVQRGATVGLVLE